MKTLFGEYNLQDKISKISKLKASSNKCGRNCQIDSQNKLLFRELLFLTGHMSDIKL